MKKLLLFFTLCTTLVASAQEGTRRNEVVGAIQHFFKGMYTADSTMLKEVIHPEARLMTTGVDREGKPILRQTPISAFVKAVGSAPKEVLNEKIWGYDVRVEQNLATVWTPYTFFRGDEFSHCGSNAFQLYYDGEGWRIIQITDTRLREGCQMEDSDLQKELSALVNNWHQAAAEANEDTYFGSMTPDAVFIGTDASERWSRSAFEAYAKKAFEGESAWAFKVTDQAITVSDDGRHAWWDELLDTWMGTCRGSGVLTKTEAGWKISHYQLSLTVPNDKIDAFKKLMD